MIRIQTSTLIKLAKCPKILQNEQNNLKPTKIHPKPKKLSVFWLSLRVFWSFSEVSMILCLFFRVQWYFGHFKSFKGHYSHYRGVLVNFQGFGIFWAFVVHFSHSSSSKSVILEGFVYLQGNFGHLLIFWEFSRVK